jgi:hypothetical protein
MTVDVFDEVIERQSPPPDRAARIATVIVA